MSGDLNLMGDICARPAASTTRAAKYAEAVARSSRRRRCRKSAKDATRRNHVFEQGRVAVAKDDLDDGQGEGGGYAKQVAVKNVPFEVQQQHELAGLIALAEKRGAAAAQEFKAANQQDPRILYLTAVAMREAGDAQRRRRARREGGEVQRPQLQLRVRQEQGGQSHRDSPRLTVPPPADLSGSCRDVRSQASRLQLRASRSSLPRQPSRSHRPPRPDANRSPPVRESA